MRAFVFLIPPSAPEEESKFTLKMSIYVKYIFMTAQASDCDISEKFVQLQSVAYPNTMLPGQWGKLQCLTANCL